MLLFSNSVSVSLSFSVSIENNRVIQIKKKRIHLLFIDVIYTYFPSSIQMNTLTLNTNCYVVFPKSFNMSMDIENDSPKYMNYLTPLTIAN